MIEVLVAIVVFSFGMLGLLGLLLNSLKMSTTSNYRSIAAEQFAAISETLNANPNYAATYAAAASSTVTSSCFSSGCTTVQLPATEYGLWQQHIATVLPSGTGSITTVGNGRPLVTICWNESRVSTATNWSTACFSAQI